MPVPKKLFLIGVFLLLCVVFVLVKHFNGLYGQDAHEYYRYAKCLLVWFRQGQNPGDYFWPIWYPLLAAVVSWVTHMSVLCSLQFISIISLGVIVTVVAFMGDENNWVQFLYALVAVGLSPFLLRSSLVAMADEMSVALVLLAVFCFSKFLIQNRDKWLYGFTFFAAWAVMTRYAVVVILFPPALVMVYTVVVGKKWTAIVFAAAIALAVCIPHLIIRSNAPLAFIHHEWVNSWSALNFFKRDFVTPDGTCHYKLCNIVFVLAGFAHPGFGVLLVPLLLFVRKEDFSSVIAKALLAGVLLYAFFLAGIPFQNKRFLLASFPVVMLLLYPAFKRLLVAAKFKWMVFSMVAAIHLFVFTRVFEEFYERNLLEKELTAVLIQRPEKIVYSFDVDMAVKSYDTSKVLNNLWLRHYDLFETGALVLFNEKLFAAQWQGKKPMLNWETLKSNYNLQPLVTREDGWGLYKIETKR